MSKTCLVAFRRIALDITSFSPERPCFPHFPCAPIRLCNLSASRPEQVPPSPASAITPFGQPRPSGVATIFHPPLTAEQKSNRQKWRCTTKTRAQYSRFANAYSIRPPLPAPADRKRLVPRKPDRRPVADAMGLKTWTGRTACGARCRIWTMQCVIRTALAAGAGRHRRLHAVPLTTQRNESVCLPRDGDLSALLQLTNVVGL